MDEQLWLQIEMAAKGCVSGTLREWPMLKRALAEQGYELPDITRADVLRDLSKAIYEKEQRPTGKGH